MAKGIWVRGKYYLPDKFDHIARKERFKSFVDSTTPTPPETTLSQVGDFLGKFAAIVAVGVFVLIATSVEYYY